MKNTIQNLKNLQKENPPPQAKSNLKTLYQTGASKK
jgi:hypothetical protein